MKKKAQIKMFETIAVLVVFFFLLSFGAVFYFRMQESAMEKELARQSQLKSLQAAQRAMFLPELDCSFVGVQRENCFDRFKVAAFGSVRERNPALNEDYFGLFGFASVSVSEEYPGEFFAVIYDNPPDEYTRALKSFSPVLLYDAALGAYAFGVMEVTTYAER